MFVAFCNTTAVVPYKGAGGDSSPSSSSSWAPVLGAAEVPCLVQSLRRNNPWVPPGQCREGREGVVDTGSKKRDERDSELSRWRSRGVWTPEHHYLDSAIKNTDQTWGNCPEVCCQSSPRSRDTRNQSVLRSKPLFWKYRSWVIPSSPQRSQSSCLPSLQSPQNLQV